MIKIFKNKIIIENAHNRGILDDDHYIVLMEKFTFPFFKHNKKDDNTNNKVTIPFLGHHVELIEDDDEEKIERVRKAISIYNSNSKISKEFESTLINCVEAMCKQVTGNPDSGFITMNDVRYLTEVYKIFAPTCTNEKVMIEYMAKPSSYCYKMFKQSGCKVKNDIIIIINIHIPLDTKLITPKYIDNNLCESHVVFVK